MINIRTFQCNPLAENCYVVSDETRQAVIIDCGAAYDSERQAIARYIDYQQLQPVHLLCTHGHLDHCFGNIFIAERYGLLPEVSADDEFLAADLDAQARSMFGFAMTEPTPALGSRLVAGKNVAFGNHELQVLPTPGHTPGSVIFYCEDERVAFSGDTLFRMSIGRTDFERGSWTDMMNSLQQQVSTLPADVTVYPGHGPLTTIADELRMNPYMKS